MGDGNGKTGIPDGVAKTKSGMAGVERAPAGVLETTSGATGVGPLVLTTWGKRVLEAPRGVAARRADTRGESAPAEDRMVPPEKGEVA
jgi:hypothetical protein